MSKQPACPACSRDLVAEQLHDVTVDRCVKCSGIWFDATELDKALKTHGPAGQLEVEWRVPKRGASSRQCPRCDRTMHTAGWSSMILDRCPKCSGVFVEVPEWRDLRARPAPNEVTAFEEEYKSAMIRAGTAISVVVQATYIIARFVFRKP